MSGPKGGSYRVETAEQREARLLRDAKSQYARAQSAWQAVESRAVALRMQTGDAPGNVRPASPLAVADAATWAQGARELETAAADLAVAVGKAREQAAEKSRAAHVARIVARIAAQPQRAPANARHPRLRDGHEEKQPMPAAEVIDWARVKQRVERRMRDLASLDHDATRAQEVLVDIAAAGAQSRIDLLLGELDYLIAQARAEATRREAVTAARGELLAMRAMIAELTGASADQLRDRIAGLIAADAIDVPPDLSAAVEVAVSRGDAEADRRHVVAVMHRALEELGYAVGPEFSTDLSGARGAGFARNGPSGYGVKVRLEPGSACFTAQAVKSDAALTTVDEDTAAEQSFCRDFEKLVTLVRRSGVELDVHIRTDAGVCAVQQVSDAELARPVASGSRRSAALNTRKQPR